jgi:hypothetical protein
MANDDTYRIRAFKRRPWVTGATYDLLASHSILHCDAYAWSSGAVAYLQLAWTEGGRVPVADDWYWIEADGLTPCVVSAATERQLTPRYWHKGNNAMMGRIHATVVQRANQIASNGPWLRVVLQAHYVLATDRSYEPAGNTWEPHAPRRSVPGTLPDLL